MKHFAGAFGLMGFVAALVMGLMREAQIASVVASAAIWGVSFGVLGFLLGKAALILLKEAGIAELPNPPEGSTAAPSDRVDEVDEVDEADEADEAAAASPSAADEPADSVGIETTRSERRNARARRTHAGEALDVALENALEGAPEGALEGSAEHALAEEEVATESSRRQLRPQRSKNSGELPNRDSEEIDREQGISSGTPQETPIEIDEALPASGALTPQTPEFHDR